MSRDEEIKEFSGKLKEAKEKLNMNHSALAVFLGYPRDTVVKWVQGLMLPGQDRRDIVLRKIAKKLG